MWRKIFTVIKTKGFSFYVPVTVDVETLKHFMHLHYFHKPPKCRFTLSSRAVATRQNNQVIVEFVSLVFK